jgi:hypothetical protein
MQINLSFSINSLNLFFKSLTSNFDETFIEKSEIAIVFQNCAYCHSKYFLEKLENSKSPKKSQLPVKI